MPCEHPLDVKHAKELCFNGSRLIVDTELLKKKEWRPSRRQKRAEKKHKIYCHCPS